MRGGFGGSPFVAFTNKPGRVRGNRPENEAWSLVFCIFIVIWVWSSVSFLVIVSLYRNKGEKSDCSNYRGITLLSIAGKILARVLLNRLIPTIAQENTSESQCGLRSNRGTVGIIFVLRQIQEKCREQNMGLYPAFVDLILSAVMDCGKSWRAVAVPPNFSPSSASFMKVSKVRWSIMGLCRAASPSPTASSRDAFWPTHCSPSSSASCSVRQMRTCQTASTSVFEQTAVSSTFGVSSHARKPSRNSSLSCCLLMTAHFSPTRRKPYSASSTASLMQPRTSASPSAWRRQVLYQPPPRVAYSPHHISIDGTNLNAVVHVSYLGNVISSDATVNKDLDNRLSKASSSFGRLSERVWQSHSLRLSTKIQIYRAVGVPTLPYSAETWCSLSETDQVTGAVSPTLLAVHPWHKMARPHVERRSPQESQPAQHRVHLASGAAALGWPCHKDGRRMHAESRLLQRAPRGKVRPWCITKTSWRDSLHRREWAISHDSRRPRTETVGAPHEKSQS